MDFPGKSKTLQFGKAVVGGKTVNGFLVKIWNPRVALIELTEFLLAANGV